MSMRLVIISGRSGSGKSIALHLLEDLGYYCIDNLPAMLLPQLVDTIKNSYSSIGICLDSRNLPQDIDQFREILNNFTKQGIQCEIIYLDAEDDTLLKRFGETRRKHPLTHQDLSLAEAIETEHDMLLPVAHLADLRVDTTHTNMYQLRKLIHERVEQTPHTFSILVQSFGFKFGIPRDSDLLFDVRCLPNPYWVPELRPFSGKDQVVQDFLHSKDESVKMLDNITGFLQNWLPHYAADFRNYFTVSIGCTGGQHRSVFIVEKLHEILKQSYNNLQVKHRELE